MDILIEPGDNKKLADDVALCARCERLLMKHYPGHLWAVKLDEDGGMVYVVNKSIQSELNTNMMYAYRLHLSRVQKDVDLKCVMRAGGEILERAGLKRGWFDPGAGVKHVEGVKQDHQPFSYWPQPVFHNDSRGEFQRLMASMGEKVHLI